MKIYEVETKKDSGPRLYFSMAKYNILADVNVTG